MTGIKSAGLLALALVVAATGATANPAEPASQTFQVAAPGRTEAALDAPMGEAIAAGERLRLLGPGGLAVPFELIPVSTTAPWPAHPTAVSELTEGWELRLDLGEERPIHDRLEVRFSEVASAPRCRLEGSADGTVWQPLAEGDLLGVLHGGDVRARTVLGYAPTRVRHLRLLWPGGAGRTHVKEATVRAVETDERNARVANITCSSWGSTGRVCRAEIPSPAHRVELAFASNGGAVGFRVLHAGAGFWGRVGDGVARPSAGSDPRVTLALDRVDTALPERILRVEVDGAASRPRVENLIVSLPALALRFDASEAGRYELAIARPGEMVFLPHLGHSTRRVERRQFSHAWTLDAPGATTGAVVELALPRDAYPANWGSVQSGIRLTHEDREIPFVLSRSDEPVSLGRFEGLEPQPGAKEGMTSVTLPVKGRIDCWTELHLRTGSRLFSRQLWLVGQENRGRGRPSADRVISPGHWICAGSAPLPCWTRIMTTGATGIQDLRLDIRDGDNPPLETVDAELWGEEHRLRFLWPGEGSVELLAGATDLAAPRYDLEALRDLLLTLPAVAARVTSEEPRAISGALKPLGRPLVIASLVLLAAVLLLLLIRLLR